MLQRHAYLLGELSRRDETYLDATARLVVDLPRGDDIHLPRRDETYLDTVRFVVVLAPPVTVCSRACKCM